MSASPLYMHRLKQSMREAWMAGDFGMVARKVARDAEEFVSRLDIAPGRRCSMWRAALETRPFRWLDAGRA